MKTNEQVDPEVKQFMDKFVKEHGDLLQALAKYDAK